MAGENNNSNAFQSQTRLAPVYIQLVPGPPGPTTVTTIPGTGLVQVLSGTVTAFPNGSADQLLGMNHAGSAYQYFTLGGDGTLSSSLLTVVGILGHALPGVTPGYLHWNGSAWVFDTPSGFTAAGDLSGSSSTQQVIGILTKALPALASGYLHYNGSAWVFDTPSSFTAGGDLSGSGTVQQVIGLLTHALPALSSGYLHWNGSAWVFDTPGSGFSAGGDLTGTISSQNVVGILTHALPALTAGYLQWTGSVWAFSALPTSLPPNGPAGGDLGLTYPNPSVLGLLTHALPALSAGYLHWNGSAWVFDTPVTTFPAPGSTISGTFAMAATDTWKKFVAGTYTITAPVSPVVGQNYELTDVTTSGSLEATPVTLASGAAYTIRDPQNTLAAPTASVTLRTSGMTYRYRYDGAVFQCVN
jgi:hypothetical protein